MCKRTPKQMLEEVRTAQAEYDKLDEGVQYNDLSDEEFNLAVENLQAILAKKTEALESFFKDTFGCEAYVVDNVINKAWNSL